ncbi:hypothetical protein M15_01830 [Atrimonas thermophila]
MKRAQGGNAFGEEWERKRGELQKLSGRKMGFRGFEEKL